MIKTARWTARIISALMVALILLFFLSHLIGGLENPEDGFDFASMSTGTVISLVFILIMTLGLLVSWKYELEGGITAMIGYLAFVFLALLDRNAWTLFVSTWPLLVCFLCGFMFVGCWYADRQRSLSPSSDENA
jgi:hypothetical protein